MYEQDYVVYLNREIARTIAKLLIGKSDNFPINIMKDTLNDEEKRMLDKLYGGFDADEIEKYREKILIEVKEQKKDALEKALLFYIYFNEENIEEPLQ